MIDIKERYRDHRLAKMERMAQALNARPGRTHSNADSPAVILPNKLKITLRTAPVQLAIAKDVERSMTSIGENPARPRTEADATFLASMQEQARSLGIAKLGYVEVAPECIFQGRSVPSVHAIILIMEIDKPPIDKAPSPETQAIGLISYERMGKSTNALVEFLRRSGFAAEAGHPAIGPTLYPRLAVQAGLGWVGRHGMLITPGFGPRQRISAIFTSIENLPVSNENEHEWLKGFCATCGNCVRKCPGKAIYKEPLVRPAGRLSHIDGGKCISCTVCMKVCSFNVRGYESIRRTHLGQSSGHPGSSGGTTGP